ncbi:hypothetical protein COW36_08605 [bacterium (Candidatus Blackallbacteria) CG17_big_fil_post_rev_8_21_14_2_50_48_46]|uniref:YbjN domain-containing protein n=1 Tax=bacterium (Candidatus Blackallbacteria) CG17_big_fil_post_rev_8_21_14_2_50_48_46 TaxID=2014261 RepID=A0A2M7G672_9BACT|nr:MAG: hypothetical protein COW64_05905 [bacterium (Candidatus Blackallbacteria) CG18_big_fil_WC_8_21_14_2_50_49_26]PIW17547.1 MAG: hypothetical protein COW36_08605 [bacterium (Candidatus Blackallbacteria) CG17_big_fil_post_rev_8_21_14_2_50_48_46]PIW48402.1 MAG: hypothetical protein COW20_09955 [bacterium (Candidatus Blackallbacteria) CG13_big_fil_rev_8_21_14_2_50_49_14]
MSKTNSPLHLLFTALQQEGAAIEWMPASPDCEVESLLVALEDPASEDPKAFQFVIRLYISDAPEKGKQGPLTLQFQMVLPVSFAELETSRHLESFQCVMGCNEILPFGALFVSPEGEVAYQYALRFDSSKISLDLVVDTLEVVGSYLPAILPALKGLIESSHSSEDLLNSVLAELES